LNQVRKSYFEGVRKMRIFTPSQNTGVVWGTQTWKIWDETGNRSGRTGTYISNEKHQTAWVKSNNCQRKAMHKGKTRGKTAKIDIGRNKWGERSQRPRNRYKEHRVTKTKPPKGGRINCRTGKA
jgi:hypothetical protein